MNARESNPSEITCTMRGDRAVMDALQMARDFGVRHKLSDDDVSRLSIIVEELFVNLVEHGGVDAEQFVTLTLAREPGGIRVVMIDPAPPFDPRRFANRGPRPARGGGAGIAIVRAWTEFIDYSTTGTGNRLELFVPIAEQS